MADPQTIQAFQSQIASDPALVTYLQHLYANTRSGNTRLGAQSTSNWQGLQAEAQALPPQSQALLSQLQQNGLAPTTNAATGQVTVDPIGVSTLGKWILGLTAGAAGGLGALGAAGVIGGSAAATGAPAAATTGAVTGGSAATGAGATGTTLADLGGTGALASTQIGNGFIPAITGGTGAALSGAANAASGGSNIWNDITKLGALAAPVVGGIVQSNAAQTAADEQLAATKAALAQQNAQYQQTRTDLGSYRDLGTSAGSKLKYLLGLS